MGAAFGKKRTGRRQTPRPLRATEHVRLDRATEPRIVLSNRSSFRVSYSVLQEDKKKTCAHFKRTIKSMSLSLNASLASGMTVSGSGSKKDVTTVETEDTAMYLMYDHRMEPTGITGSTDVLFPVGCQQLRVFVFFQDEEGRWVFCKNKAYSIDPKKRGVGVLLTSLNRNILPYIKGQSKPAVRPPCDRCELWFTNATFR